MLFHTAPNLRGDDVTELQTRLARLGFHCGKVDGIFGPFTAKALAHFQRNCGLPTDAVCGPETLRLLERLGSQSGSGPGVAVLREQETMRSSTLRLASMRIVIGHDGGLGSVTRSAARQLRSAGASVVPLDDPDPSVQAHTANQFEANVYIGLHSSEEPAARVVYYEVPTFHSAAGKALAEQVRACLLAHRVFQEVEVEGRRLPILRETQMPAVWCELGPTRHVADQGVPIAAACADALNAWSSRS